MDKKSAKASFLATDNVTPFLISLFIFVVVVAIIPIFVGAFGMHIAVLVAINTFLVTSLSIIYRTGLLSFAHVAFIAVAAYTDILMGNVFGWPFIVTAPIAIVTVLVLAAVIGWICMRFRDVQFVLVTFCFSQLVYLLLLNSPAITGGANGINHMQPLDLFGIVVEGDLRYYILAASLALITLVAAFMFYRTPMGRTVLAIEMNERLASATGVNVFGIRLAIFVVAAGLAGIGGIVWTHYNAYASPESFTYLVSINLIIMMVVGSRTSIWGAPVGAIIMTPLPELLRSSVEGQHIYYGIILLFIVRLLPGGIVSIGELWRRPGRGEL